MEEGMEGWKVGRIKDGYIDGWLDGCMDVWIK